MMARIALMRALHRRAGGGDQATTQSREELYVDTSKQIGDADHLKVFVNRDAAERWFAEK